MRVAFICPSNMLYMPYVENYKEILKQMGVDIQIINWDRFNIEDSSEFVYRDSKLGHQRGFFDYYKYSKFITILLKKHNFDRVIIFGVQLTFFMKRILLTNYSNKFIIDIRDHNKIIKYFNLKKIIDKSDFTVVSSPAYREWLPKSNKYVICHNASLKSLKKTQEFTNLCLPAEKISIGCIGALRDYQVNIDLIDSLMNSDVIKLNYHGKGDINDNVLRYLDENNIHNVSLTGKYDQAEEKELYHKNDIINVLRYNDDINNKTALPNRLYNAVLYGKPLLGFEGTYLSEVIKEYHLGLVINSFINTEGIIIDYVNNFNVEIYKKGRILFFESVLNENNHFYIKLKNFINMDKLEGCILDGAK